MKKIHLLFIPVLFSGFQLTAQWAYVGNPGISQAQADYNCIAFNSSGTPYIAYQDQYNNGQFSVKEFGGTDWLPVGTPAWASNEHPAYQVSLAMDPGGNPYVFCTDNNYGTVRKYDGANWVFVGDSQFTLVRPDYLKMTIAGNGTPYVVFSNFYNNEVASVMKFDGQQWDTVGNQYLSTGQAIYNAIACDGNSTPYIVFADYDKQLKATVMKFNGTGWDTVGPRGFTAGEADYTCIAIDNNGIPYIAYEALASNADLNVMKYTGGSWVQVGNADFTGISSQYLSLAIDNNNVPYVAFEDSVNGEGQATVMRLGGNAWVPVGARTFTVGDAPYIALAISPVTNIPYVVFTDGNDNGRVSVMSDSDAISAINNLAPQGTVQLYPNPANNLLQVTTAGFVPDAITIYDVSGQKITICKYTRQMDISALSGGIYFMELTNASNSVIKKFVKM